MSVTDPIADMFNRIRNAHTAGILEIEVPHSRLKSEIASVLKREGFVDQCGVEGEGTRKIIRLRLKYYGQRQAGIRGLRRTSKPGLRHYVKADNLPRVLGGMGVAILSTSAGILTDREARTKNMGGEVLCWVW